MTLLNGPGVSNAAAFLVVATDGLGETRNRPARLWRNCLDVREARAERREGRVAKAVAPSRRGKLSHFQRLEIRALKGREKCAYLALAFGVSEWTIYQVWAGR
jgi:hypothetical protein